MNNFYKVLFLLFHSALISTSLCQELNSWIPENISPDANLDRTQFVDLDHGFIGGSSTAAAIFGKSTDGGYTWSVQNFPYQVNNILTFFVDPDFGDYGQILKYVPIKLLKPNGGESLLIGSNEPIKWYSDIPSLINIKIEYSTDGGLNWNLIASAVPISDSSYIWNVPNTPSIHCVIKISDVANAALFEVSDNSFIIRAGVINVPSDFPTIQGAIDFAQPGDSIIVQPGVYVENIDLYKEGLMIVGNGDSDEVIIDGSQTSFTFYCSGDNNIIKGFTIINGSGPAGGIYTGSNSEFDDLIIKNNHANQYGGGLRCSGSAKFRNVVIEDNYGGGIYLELGAYPLLENVIIRNNSANFGGGIRVDATSNGNFNNVLIYNNYAYTYGGGIYCDNGQVEYTGLKIVYNRAGEKGGGIYQFGEPFVLANSVICNNSAGNQGGGIYCENLVNIDSCTISFNRSDLGGGIFIDGVSANITRTTITNNYAVEGNGIYRANQNYANITQSNFYNNSVAIYNNSTTYLVSAENNWWGDSLRPLSSHSKS